MKPKFLLDEQMSPEVASAASRLGLDVTSVCGSELEGLSDWELLRVAARQGRILVIQDIGDFVPLFGDLIRGGAEGPGMIYVSSKSFRPGDVRSLLRSLVRLSVQIEQGEVHPGYGIMLEK